MTAPSHSRALLPALLLLGACHEFGLAPPPVVEQRPPPVLSTVTPHEAWAGDRLTLRGHDLGSAIGTHVAVGGVAATVVAASAAQDELTVLLPEEVPALIPVQPVVTTEGGATQLPADAAALAELTVRPLGLGHPKALEARDSTGFGPNVEFGNVLGDKAYLFDLEKGFMLVREPSTGGRAGPVVITQNEAMLAFGTPASLYVYAVGFVGEVPTLRAYDTTGPWALEACPALYDAPELPVSADDYQALSAMVSPSGKLLTVPLGDSSILLVTPECPPALTPVDVAGAGTVVRWALPASDTTLLCLVEQALDVATFQWLVRVDLTAAGPVLAAGEPFTDDALADTSRAKLPALDPAGGRLAYPLAQGGVGFATWPDQGPPVLAPERVDTLSTARKLAWTPAGDALLVATDSLLVSYDAGPGFEPTGSAAVGGLAVLAPIAQGPAAGAFFGAGTSTTYVFSKDARQLNSHPQRYSTGDYQAYGKQPALKLALRSEVDPELQGRQSVIETMLVAGNGLSTIVYADPMFAVSPYDLLVEDGVVSAGSTIVGWWGATAQRLSGQVLTEIEELPGASAPIFAAAADATNVAVLTRSGTGAVSLELLGGSAGPLPLPKVPAALAFRGGSVFVASDFGTRANLTRYEIVDGALQARETTPIGESAASVLSVWSSPGLGGVLAALAVPWGHDASTAQIERTRLVLWTDDGRTLVTHAGAPLSWPLALSADGKALLFSPDTIMRPRPTLDLALLSVDEGGALRLERGAHADLSSYALTAVPSTLGDRFWVMLDGDDQVIELR